MSATSLIEIVELPQEAREDGPAPAPARAARFTRFPVVYVLFTSPAETVTALRVGCDLAQSFGGTVRLVDFRVVQVGAPVEWPTGHSRIETTGFLEHLRAEGLDIFPHVYVCRDARYAVRQVFPPHSLVVIGARHRWWRTRGDRWRRMLERQGHLVVMVDPGVLT